MAYAGMDRAMLTAAVVLALLLASAPSEGLEEDGVSFVYIGVTERLERGLGPAPSSGPVTVVLDGTGDRMLVIGHEHADDLRVLDRDMTLMGVLEPPYDDFSVSGATISERGTWVLAWGRTPSNATDVMMVFDLADFQPDIDLVPGGTVAFDRITAAHVLAEGLIIAVGGTDALGNTRMAFVETLRAAELRNDTYPGSGSVVSLRDDGHDLYALLDDGTVLVYSTTNWTLDVALDLLEAPLRSWDIRPGGSPFFGSGGGEVVALGHMRAVERLDLTLLDAPVQGLYSSGFHSHLVVAVPGEATGSELDVFMFGEEGWYQQSSTPLDGEVTALVGDPGSDATFAACMADGSVDFHTVVLVKKVLPPRPGSWGDAWGQRTAGVLVLVVVVALSVALWRRRGAGGQAST